MRYLQKKHMKKLVFVLLMIAGIAACKKDKAATPSVVGFWEGNYGNGSTVPDQNYCFLFRSNGTVRVYADATDTATAGKAEGTYIVTGNTVKTTYTYPANLSYSTLATADAEFKTLDGTWGDNANTSGRGTFRVFKK